MTYLKIKIKNGKEYFYLRKSQREGNKIKSKDVFYIGKNISKKKINEIKSKYKLSQKELNQITKKAFLIELEKENKKENPLENKYLTRGQLKKINKIKKSYKEKKLSQEFKINFIVENIHMDSKEKLLTKNTIKKIIFDKIIPRNKSLNEIQKIANIYNLLCDLDFKKKNIDLELPEYIYGNLIKDISFYRTNEYRNSKIKNFSKNNFKISKEKEIKQDMKKIIKWFNKENSKINPFALSIMFHHKFERIHPFLNMNGLVGRIILNYTLQKNNFPPITIPLRKKQEYFKALKKADKAVTKDLLSTDMRYYSELINFMCQQFIETYLNYFQKTN